MTAGFLLAWYSCVSNDVIQTIGTFLTSNGKRSNLTIWLFVAGIMAATMTYGFIANGGAMAFGRLDLIPMAEVLHWWHLLPLAALILLTWRGVPISTTFLILSVFSSEVVFEQMLIKSFLGYVIAFLTAVFAYNVISKKIERRFIDTSGRKPSAKWTVLQWASTAFLWSQWIRQDAANIMVFLPRQVGTLYFVLIVAAMAALLWITVARRGGKIQKIVALKTNVADVRSATVIDFFYGAILMFFQEYNNVPMSTTWVFVGLLAGREISLHYRLGIFPRSKMWRDVLRDLGRVCFGLLVSLAVVFAITRATS
jgi:hypothetical protein